MVLEVVSYEQSELRRFFFATRPGVYKNYFNIVYKNFFYAI